MPTSKELIGILSARTTLASQVEACTKFVCGAVLVASEPGCRWWAVNSRVFAPDKTVIGSLQTIAGPSKPNVLLLNVSLVFFANLTEALSPDAPNI